VALAPGRWIRNPATGEVAHLIAADADGRRLSADLWLQPGAAVAGAHIHRHVVERFAVRVGEVGFNLDGEERVARAGDDPVEVPAGVVHDWWNAGGSVARVHVEVAATPAAPGQPAARFVAMIEAAWSLGALGQVDSRGMPDTLWLAAIAREYNDAIRFVKPPAWVQAVLFGPLAAIARRTGRDPTAPRLHGPAGACAMPEPDEESLAALLDHAVGTPAA
jgi:mannose-6-phosphate isomerase-like protein (cupin superfamily)